MIANPGDEMPMDLPPPTRRLGSRHAAEPGPLLLVVASIHGNEPAGRAALERFLAAFDESTPGFRGDVVALCGNVGASADDVRYRDHDMNRRWSGERIAGLKLAGPSDRDREDDEQLALSHEIDDAMAKARGPVTFVDLHTTSAGGHPFSMVADRPDSIALALPYELPVIVGLLERVDGVLLEYMRRKGCATLGIEAGQHRAACSVDYHEAILTMALAATGIVPAASLPSLPAMRERLVRARGPLPRMMRVERRHAITPDDRFVMEPGFANIQPIDKGQVLARDRRGEIRADEAGILFMPLYQGLGDDGFFLGRALAVEG